MDFLAKKGSISKIKTQCAVVFVINGKLLDSAKELDAQLCGALSSVLKSGDLEKSAGKTAWISVPSSPTKLPYERILLVQAGSTTNTNTLSSLQWQKITAAAAAHISNSKAKDAAVFCDSLTLTTDGHAAREMATILAQSFVKSSYRYTTTKTDVKTPLLKKVSYVCNDTKNAKLGLAQGAAIGLGINSARELGNLPGNICTPSYLASEALSLAKANPKLSTKIVTEKQMEKLGMGSLLSVSRGSDEEAKLIVMEYRNAAKTAKPHVLVGKGITFDTGGISLKPGAAMDEMKFDMCGAASVFGAMHALVAMKAPVNVVAIVAAAENMPSGRATKPGDVVTSMSGQTIEVLNTDAEGRLVLCDALTYAERFKPKSVVDVATLTGACVIALGSHATGLYSNDEKLATALLEAGKQAQDKAWQMPLWDEYQKQLDSNFADIANIGGREAGSVTAACFLSRFTKKYPWAHLDIAGTAWMSGARKGATGRPVGLLVEYLLNN